MLIYGIELPTFFFGNINMNRDDYIKMLYPISLEFLNIDQYKCGLNRRNGIEPEEKGVGQPCSEYNQQQKKILSATHGK